MSAESASDSPILSLSAPILVRIFSHLSYDTLQDLKMVCKFFKKVIKSAFKHREWVMFVGNCDFIVHEKCLNLKVDALKLVELNRFLDGKLNGEHMHGLYIYNISDPVEIDINEFKNVLIRCPNLRRLDTSINFKKIRREDLTQNLPTLHLEWLAYSKDPEYFKIFKNCTTERLKLYFGLDPFMANTQPIKTFLSSQKSLTELELWFTGRGLSLFSDDQLHSVDFRLKRLKMVGKGLQFTDLTSFEKFAVNHRSSLERLEIFACQNVIDSFMQFENLTTVDLKEVQVTSEPFEHVQRLSLTNVTGQYIMKFPNVTRMYINTSNLTSLDFRPLQKLKYLEFSVLKIEYIVLPNITELKLICVGSFIKFSLPGTIEAVTLKDCMNVDWFADYLKENKRLKTVKIMGSSVTDRLVKCVSKLSHVNNYLAVL